MCSGTTDCDRLSSVFLRGSWYKNDCLIQVLCTCGGYGVRMVVHAVLVNHALRKLVCVCACDYLFVCGPRIKFCALAQTWVVTQSLVSKRGVIGSHHGESLCLFLVDVQIIMSATNKQWN
jgi:hypothetical protein